MWNVAVLRIHATPRDASVVSGGDRDRGRSRQERRREREHPGVIDDGLAPGREEIGTIRRRTERDGLRGFVRRPGDTPAAQRTTDRAVVIDRRDVAARDEGRSVVDGRDGDL